MTPRSISNNMTGLGRVGSISARLFLSGAFRPTEYCKLIPGLKGNTLKAYVHVTRHGVRNSAFLSRDPVSAWLIPEIVSGRIGPLQARTINRNIRKDGRVELSKDFICTRDYLAADFKVCLDVLAETSPNYRLKFCHLMLRGPYHLAEIMPFMEAIHQNYVAGIWKDNLDAQKMYRDLSLATGSTAETLAKMTRQMVDLAANQRNPSNFYLGFQETKAAPPTANVEESYAEYALFQDVAARNALRHKDYLILKRGKNGWEIASTVDAKCVGVCVPPPEIWVNSAPFAKTVKRNFEGLLELLDRKTALLPMLFPYARDLTHMNAPCERVISYHSFASNRDDMLHYKESSLRGLCSFDKGGYSGAALTSSSVPEFAGNTPPSTSVLSYKELHKTGALSKYTNSQKVDQPEPLTDLHSRKYILIALQVSDDSAARWHGMNPMDMVRWGREAVGTDDVCILVKPHPKDNFGQFADRLDALSSEHENIQITTGALEPLLENAALVVTANSGVGLEALLYGKPTVTTGLSEYRPATHYAPDEDSLKLAISNLLNAPHHPQNFGWLNDYFEKNLWNGQNGLPADHIISRFFQNS